MNDSQEIAAQQFIDANPEYKPSPENFEAIKNIIEQHRLYWNLEGMEAAFRIALETGCIERSKSLVELERMWNL